MAAPISMGGLATGLDTQGIISQLVQASQGPLNALQNQQSDIQSASSTLSNIGKSLAALETAAGALSSAQQAAGYTASSTGSAVVATASGDAQPGAYDISVQSLATEQRTYSAAFASSSDALGQSGKLTIQVGSGASAELTIDATDSLDSIAAKINGAGIRVGAAVFYDGSSYRLQLRGLDTGGANALTFVETGTSLDLNGTGQTESSGRTVQQAKDAQLTIDGFAVTRSTNQISGAIPGVTFALTQTTTSPVTITVANDPSALATKLRAVVSAYNQVITQIHAAAGFGTQKASSSVLAGDSSLRMVTDRLASAVTSIVGSGSSKYSMLASIGVSVTKDGQLSLDDGKLAAAVNDDSASVQKLLAGSGLGAKGAMGSLHDLVDALTSPITGTLGIRGSTLDSQSKLLGTRIDDEQRRLDAYAQTLQKQFSAMEISYQNSQSLIAQLSKISSQ